MPYYNSYDTDCFSNSNVIVVILTLYVGGGIANLHICIFKGIECFISLSYMRQKVLSRYLTDLTYGTDLFAFFICVDLESVRVFSRLIFYFTKITQISQILRA